MIQVFKVDHFVRVEIRLPRFKVNWEIDVKLIKLDFLPIFFCRSIWVNIYEYE